VVTLGLYTLFTFLANVAETAIGVVVLFLPPTGSSYGPSRLPTCTQTVWNVVVGDPGSTHSSGNDIGNLLIMPTTTSTPENNQYSNEPGRPLFNGEDFLLGII
jgi:hypothetical protein